jgi:hypothetical protein
MVMLQTMIEHPAINLSYLLHVTNVPNILIPLTINAYPAQLVKFLTLKTPVVTTHSCKVDISEELMHSTVITQHHVPVTLYQIQPIHTASRDKDQVALVVKALIPSHGHAKIVDSDFNPQVMETHVFQIHLVMLMDNTQQLVQTDV